LSKYYFWLHPDEEDTSVDLPSDERALSVINGLPVYILLDNGILDNILQSSIAACVKLPVESKWKFLG